MHKIIYTVLFILTLTIPTFPQQSAIILSDNFESYQNGSNGMPIWTVTKGFWQIEKGKFVQKTKQYDCGVMLNIFLDTSFEIATNFRVIEGEAGAGFFFHSEDYHSTEFSHMSRFESNQSMLIGHFMQGGYECTHSARFKKQNFSKWHRLVLRVDQDQRQYSIFLDDKPISESEPILFPAGYCGLQSSGGVIEFDNVTLTRLSMKREPVALSWLRHFLVTKKNEIVVPHQAKGIIQRVNIQGKLIGSFGTHINYKGQFEKPTSIARLSNGDYVIGDEGLHCIHIFDKKGNWKNSVGYFGSGNEQFNQPADICANEKDNIFVVDTGNNRIQVWDKELNFITEFGKNELDHPVAVATNKEKVYVLNNGMNQVEIYLRNHNKTAWQGDFGFGSGQARDMLIHDHNIYIAVGNEIRLFNEQGDLIKKFRGESIKGIYPFGLAIDKDEQIYVADFRTGHIIVLDKGLSEPQPMVNFLSNTQAEITFQSNKEVQASLRITRQDSVIFDHSDNKALEHRFEIENLTPSTTYHVQFSPTVQTIPQSDGFSRKYAFITPPEPGKKHYWSLPMATIIFTSVLDTARWKPSFPALPPLPQDELDRIKAQIEDGIRFYWTNSAMNLYIDNDYIIVDDRLFHHEIFGSQWWHPPKQGWVNRAIEKAGNKIENYIAVLYLACVRDFNEKIGKYQLRGRGGGFTAGIGANSQYGLSYWEVTHANHGSGNNWLMTHEFHHQLDELFLVSGYPEYWFNHFSPTINTADDFGEHFDGNAWILKNWPVPNWYNLKFGELKFTVDEDNDGIPDNDPSLPLDEKRLQSSPRIGDTDGDGLSDLAEVTRSNWIIEGCGETYGGARLFPNLWNSDTDGDELSDNEDPYPLYPFKPVINFGPTNFDEISTEVIEQKIPFANFFDNRIHAIVYAGWDSSNLCFAFKMDRLAPIKLMIDADADGWFIGRNNYLIYLQPENDSTLTTDLQIINCSHPQKWPFHDDELAKKISVTAKMKQIDDECLVNVIISKNESTGLELEAGEKIGVNIGFSITMDSEGHQRYITIFEPNRFFDVTLEISESSNN
ncbi:MAG: NHL repeat-containing protein [bacterium]|nr:MAG: NHL repeat-containing protein [bacterium]